MESVELKILQDEIAKGLPLPSYASEGSSGMDIRAAIPEGEVLVLEPGDTTRIPTGLRMSVPRGYEIQFRPRSGLALKNGITILNSPGTVDSDYVGPCDCILTNLGRVPFEIRRGDRIAQAVVAKVERVKMLVVDALEQTERGGGGFGSTGVR